MIAVPYSVHGWSPDRTATKDPRVPVKCDWCLGAGRLLEMDHRGAFGASLVLVVCSRCDGAGKVPTREEASMIRTLAVAVAVAVSVSGASALGDVSDPQITKPPTSYTIARAKLVKAVMARDAARAEVRALRRTLATSPDAEMALQVAGIVYGQNWRHMQRCWLSEGYRNAERRQSRIVRLNRGGSGASGPAQFMPGTWAGTPFGHLDIFNVTAQAMATGWMWRSGRRGEWAGVGCR